MDLAAFIIAVTLSLGVLRCSDNSHLERQVESKKEFTLNGSEFFCLRSPKQMDIDRLNAELAKVKATK